MVISLLLDRVRRPGRRACARTTFACNATLNQFTEYYPGGSQCIYKNQGETWASGTVRHDLAASISPAGLRTTYTYGTGAETGYPKTVEMPTGRIVSMTYSASTPTSLLSSIEDWSGRIWTLQYDAGRRGCHVAVERRLSAGSDISKLTSESER